MSAGAGTTIADVEAKLAEHGQQLIAEPPDFSSLLHAGPNGAPAQTLGGIIATNLSGPRRVAWGRDARPCARRTRRGRGAAKSCAQAAAC